MKDHYPAEKFTLAAHTLAVGLASLQQRIADAFSYNLLLLDSHDLPGNVRQQLSEYQAAWQAVDDPDKEGTIVLWAKELSDDDAVQIATWIVETAAELDHEYHLEED